MVWWVARLKFSISLENFKILNFFEIWALRASSFWTQNNLAHRNRSDFCDCDAHRGPQKSLAICKTLHCDLRVQWKVASDLRFQVAISEPKTPSFCGISGDLAPSTRKSLAIAIVRFWCAKQNKPRGPKGKNKNLKRQYDEIIKLSIRNEIFNRVFFLSEPLSGRRKTSAPGLEFPQARMKIFKPRMKISSENVFFSCVGE